LECAAQLDLIILSSQSFLSLFSLDIQYLIKINSCNKN
jgi:hypothetical protein